MFTMVRATRMPGPIRRRELIAEARRILATEGVDALTTRRIAHAAGLTEGAIYRHFRGKRDILLGLVDELDELVVAELQRAQARGGSALETLEHLLQEWFSSAERRRGVGFIVIAQVLLNGDSALRRRIRSVLQQHLTVVQDLLEQAVKAGDIDATVDTEAAALAFFGLVQSTVTLWRFTDSKAPLTERSGALWNVFRNGLRARPAT